MGWVISENHSEAKLGQNHWFGYIRRSPDSRKSQIQYKMHSGTIWCDLIDYRYGMNQIEREKDIEQTGIPDEDWKQAITLKMRSEVKEFCKSKVSPCFS